MNYFRGNGREFRATDVQGRPLSAAQIAAEGDSARTDRVRALQARWQEREIPSTNPATILAEWLAASPGNRMSALAMRLADHPELVPLAEVESDPPTPGGLIERLRKESAERYAAAHRNTGQMRLWRLSRDPGSRAGPLLRNSPLLQPMKAARCRVAMPADVMAPLSTCCARQVCSVPRVILKAWASPVAGIPGRRHERDDMRNMPRSVGQEYAL
jgi:hypothetical protein